MGYFDYAIERKEECLEHHGIRGQKWGVRRFQNSDGSLTPQGRSRYGDKADKVEKKISKATKWEDRAVNAKTGVGRSLATSVAIAKRQAADKAADKATGDYKMLALNKNASRSLASAAETNARIAQGIKNKADKVTGVKHDKLVNAAIKNLAAANNLEIGAKAYSKIADAKGLKKGAEYIKQNINLTFGDYTTASGGKSTYKNRLTETIGNAVIDAMINGVANAYTESQGATTPIKLSAATATNAVGKARDAAYRSRVSADKRWDIASR